MNRTDVTLRNFFVFNSLYGIHEGEESKKVLYYHPQSDNVDVQIRNVGLVEGIIQFTKTFKPSSSVSSLHTQNIRQLYFQPEKNFWIVITLNTPTNSKNKDSANLAEHVEEDLQDNVFEAVLKQAYYMYRLFWGTFSYSVETKDVNSLKTKLEHFYKSYLNNLKLAHTDILNIFSGIQYLPLDKVTFLKVQGFINLLECNYPDIASTAFLYNDHLIWSGIEPNDMKTVYQYLIGSLLPANMETELQGGSMPRSSFSPFTVLHHGRFITGPGNLKTATSVGKVPKVYLFSDNKWSLYYLLVYRALSASVCLFVEASTELTLQFFKNLDEFISPKLTTIASDISEYCSRQVVTPSNTETSPKFIYFNKLNLAYKSTVHLDNKQTGNLACPKESVKIMTDLHDKKSILGHSSEIIVKTMNDCWVVAKTSNMREFYIALQTKNASVIDINDEVKKLCETELKGIFFHVM